MNNTNNNGNGRGIFIAVVGIATLIVTAIGATFAYFVASATGNTNKVAANSATFALGLTESYDIRTQLIPVTDAIMDTSYSTKNCKVYSAAGGSTQYDGCSTYTFTVTNNANVSQTIHVSFKTGYKTFTNLYYILYDGADNAGTAVTTAKAVPANNATDSNIVSATLAAGASKTYTVSLWIHETSGNQTTADSGKTFTGTVTISSANGSSNITGVINQAS